MCLAVSVGCWLGQLELPHHIIFHSRVLHSLVVSGFQRGKGRIFKIPPDLDSKIYTIVTSATLYQLMKVTRPAQGQQDSSS